MDINNICTGCLSSGRKLFYITEETKLCKCFYDECLIKKKTFKICWECREAIKNMMKFKDQVKKAQLYLKDGATGTSLSTLTKTSSMAIYTYTHRDEEISIKSEQDASRPVTQCKVDQIKKYGAALNVLLPTRIRIELNRLYTHQLEPKIEFEEQPETLFLETEPFNEAFTDSDEEPLCRKQKTKAKIKKKAYEPKNQPKSRKDRVPQGLEVILLTWEEVEEERCKILDQATFKEYKYKCLKCATGFNHGIKFENHMKKHDLSAGSFTCSVCSVRFKDQKALAAHRRRHRVRWRCVECLATYSRCAVAADHLVKAHNRKLERTCNVCGENMPTESKLRSHMRNAHMQSQTCELCGKTLKDKTSLQTHMLIHRGVKEYNCPHCNKGFLFKNAMQIHAATHELSDPFYCLMCDMTYKNQNSYYIHMKYNLKHIDPVKLKYACTDCDKRFSQEARLREHRDAKHLKQTPIRCSIAGCTFACSSRPALRSHIRSIHRKIRSRNHVCHLCGKTYTAKRSLEGHLRSHDGSRPLACSICNATFSYEAALYNHNKLLHKGNNAQ